MMCRWSGENWGKNILEGSSCIAGAVAVGQEMRSLACFEVDRALSLSPSPMAQAVGVVVCVFWEAAVCFAGGEFFNREPGRVGLGIASDSRSFSRRSLARIGDSSSLAWLR